MSFSVLNFEKKLKIGLGSGLRNVHLRLTFYPKHTAYYTDGFFIQFAQVQKSTLVQFAQIEQKAKKFLKKLFTIQF